MTKPKTSAIEQLNTRILPGDYEYTGMVSHRGTVVAFAMDTERRVKYSVLDLSNQTEEQGYIDKAYWTVGKQGVLEVPFPNELDQVGYGVAKNFQMPLRKKDGSLLDLPKEQPVLADTFHSSTARLTAQAPFQVLSDGKYIYLFRQALSGEDMQVDKIKNTPVVNNTLLVDRFILSGTVLMPSREIRYQRSRHKTEPASAKDTLGPVGMDKKPFYEPTRELAFAENLIPGGFAVLIVPTQETEVSRWIIFSYDKVSNKINVFNIRRHTDGWFDPKDSEEFVDQFTQEKSLNGKFTDKIYEQIRDNKLDKQIAEILAGKFGDQLSTVSADELAEVVFTVRTGLMKDDFTLGDYYVTDGLSAVYYYQQEIEFNNKLMKNKACVMLAMGTGKEGQEKNHIAVLNFAVSNEGKLSRITRDELSVSNEVKLSRGTNDELYELKIDNKGVVGEVKQAASYGSYAISADYRVFSEYDALGLRTLGMQSADSTNLAGELKKLTGEIDAQQEEIKKYRKDFIATIQDKREKLKEWREKPEKAMGIDSSMTGNLYKEFLVESKCKTYTSSLESVEAAIQKLQGRQEEYVNHLDIMDESSGELRIDTKGVIGEVDQAAFFGNYAIPVDYRAFSGHVGERRDRRRPVYDGTYCLKHNNLESHNVVFDKDDRPTLRRVQDFEKTVVLSFYEEIQKKLEKLQQQQEEKNNKENELSKRIKTVKMPIVCADGKLTTSGGVLDFAYGAGKPCLFDDSYGRINLYFKGQNETFFVTYFNPQISEKSPYGQWEAYDPGRAIAFDRALEAEEGEEKAGLLTAKDANDDKKLEVLAPTAAGLSLEAWINPREIHNEEKKSQIIYYHYIHEHKHHEHYSLGIQKHGDGYRCFAAVGDKQVRIERDCRFENWLHVAVTYKKYWGVKLDKGASVNCGNHPSLNLDGEYTIEAFIRSGGNEGTILEKEGEYCLGIADKKLFFWSHGKIRVPEAPKITVGEGFAAAAAIMAGAITGPFGTAAGIVAAKKILDKSPENIELDTDCFYKVSVIRSRTALKEKAAPEKYPITANNGTEKTKWWKDKGTEDVLKGLAEKVDQMENKAALGVGGIGPISLESDIASDDKYFFTIVVQEIGKEKNLEPIILTTSDRIEDKQGNNYSDVRIGGANFEGTLDEVRIWNRALAKDECGERNFSDKNGLLAWWRIDEGEGKYVYDDAGNNHGTIIGEYQWVDSPDTQLPRFKCYLDGKQEAANPVAEDPQSKPEMEIINQFSLGGKKIDESKSSEHFIGTLEEVRVWGVARSAEEITDNVFSRLKGETEKLLANYTFDTDFSITKKSVLAAVDGITEKKAEEIWDQLISRDIITVNGTLAKDETVLKESLAGLLDRQQAEVINALKSPPEIHDVSYNSIILQVTGQVWDGHVGKENITQVLSTAPVSTEIPVVRSALSGVKTEYHSTVSSTPAVVEYGDVQKNDDGTLNGVLKRCYAYIKDQKWHLVTGYKVGNLVTEWYGQAQYDPQIIGYIEGPPPVPGENLSIEKSDDANDIGASIELEESEEITYSCSVSKEAGFMVAAESEGEMGGAAETIIAPLGIGLSLKANLSAKFQSNFESNNSWSESVEKSVGINKSKSLSASLAGYDNEKDGDERYYVPGNTGYALVKSKTADVYVLRLAHNDAMVSIYYQPNPDIPEDQNIISFPMNPFYVKQGVLDGKFNGEPDKDHYPNAGTYGEYSYYKPKEAYALKRQIEREALAAKAFYENFNTAFSGEMVPAGAVMGALQHLSMIPGAGLIISGLLNTLGGGLVTGLMHGLIDIKDKVANMVSQRNLVNTYVWTVEGGFYAESTQVTENQQETTDGNFSLSFSGGMGLHYAVESGAVFDQSSLFSTGSSFTMTKSKTKEASKSFGLNVSVELPTSPRYKYKGTTLEKGLISPGTVDAYRFMSFYLEPQANNYVELFTKVIDPKWLEESQGPNAVALRQARNDEKKPFCWRVMHRVTFVSRVLPEFSSEAPPSLEKTMKAQNIESNYMLIKMLEPYVKSHVGNQDTFNEEIDKVVKKEFPEFEEYAKEIKAYAADYFGVE